MSVFNYIEVSYTSRRDYPELQGDKMIELEVTYISSTMCIYMREPRRMYARTGQNLDPEASTVEQVPRSARLLNDNFDVIYRREHSLC